jgi:hypothetical protein
MRYLIIAFVFLLSSCAIGMDTAREKESDFNRQKATIEGSAKAGELTWVSAITQERELDKQFALQATTVYHINPDRYSYSPSWKFDSDDDEYYAFCIELAEQLDQKKITYAQFDSARTRKFNQIQARRAMINSQQQPQQQPMNCMTRKIGVGDSYTYCD